MSLPSPSPSLRIRRMMMEDLEAVREIDKLSFSLPWPENAFRYEINENPGSLAWVAEWVSENEPPRVVGLVVIWMILDEAHIATISVHPDCRQKGIAQRMLAAALSTAIQRGAVSATLEVRASNAPAQALYRRFGFQVVGGRQRYYKDNNEDALIMTVAPLGSTYLQWLERDGWLTPPAGSA